MGNSQPEGMVHLPVGGGKSGKHPMGTNRWRVKKNPAPVAPDAGPGRAEGYGELLA